MKFNLQHSPLFAALTPRAARDAECLLSYYAAQTLGDEGGEHCHAAMSRHALADDFDPNTGGWVWLSYSVHVIGAESLPVLAIAGCDSCALYMLPEGTDPASADPATLAGWVWDMEGDEDAAKLAVIYVEDDGGDPVADFARYCEGRRNSADTDARHMFWHRLLGSVRKAAGM